MTSSVVKVLKENSMLLEPKEVLEEDYFLVTSLEKVLVAPYLSTILGQQA